MKITNIPAKVYAAFSNAAGSLKRTIPTASQQASATPNAASWYDGFPPITAQLSGGIAPSILDFNGVLNAITVIQQYQSGGGLFTYDAAWATANGGYPKGALLLQASGAGYWQNLVDDNSSNPDTGGANWFNWSKSNLDTLYATTSSLTTLSTALTNLTNSVPGVGQTVTDVTGSRAFGTPFVNGTNRTITCLVSLGHPGPNGSTANYDITVGGVVIHTTMLGDANGSNYGDTRALYSFPVPAGATYRIDYAAGSTATLYKWVEYR